MCNTGSDVLWRFGFQFSSQTAESKFEARSMLPSLKVAVIVIVPVPLIVADVCLSIVMGHLKSMPNM